MQLKCGHHIQRYDPKMQKQRYYCNDCFRELKTKQACPFHGSRGCEKHSGKKCYEETTSVVAMIEKQQQMQKDLAKKEAQQKMEEEQLAIRSVVARMDKEKYAQTMAAAVLHYLHGSCASDEEP